MVKRGIRFGADEKPRNHDEPTVAKLADDLAFFRIRSFDEWMRDDNLNAFIGFRYASEYRVVSKQAIRVSPTFEIFEGVASAICGTPSSPGRTVQPKRSGRVTFHTSPSISQMSCSEPPITALPSHSEGLTISPPFSAHRTSAARWMIAAFRRIPNGSSPVVRAFPPTKAMADSSESSGIPRTFDPEDSAGWWGFCSLDNGGNLPLGEDDCKEGVECGSHNCPSPLSVSRIPSICSVRLLFFRPNRAESCSAVAVGSVPMSLRRMAT